MVRGWWIARRNALLASPRFQRFALRFPPMRPVARRRARQLFDLVAGFTYSQTLSACVELSLFERLAQGPASIAALALAIDLTPSALQRLVGAAAALGLLERLGDEHVALGQVGAALLGNPGVRAMIAHHSHLYTDLADPVALLRRPGGDRLAAFWDYAQGDVEQAVAPYSELMASSLQGVAEQLFGAYDLGVHRRLLDVGGGVGAFLQAVRTHRPHLELGLLDLAAVAERARCRLDGMATIHAGDFRRDPLPTGYDCITLIRVLHDHDDDVALALLRSIRRALPEGGTLVIAEPMAGVRGAEPVGATYFGWYLRAMGTGRARSSIEIRAMLREAGFARSRCLSTALPLSAGVIVAVNRI